MSEQKLLSRTRLSTTYITPFYLWIAFFCYATFAALIFQKILLPMIPSLHAGSGLLANDASHFHSVAINMAKAINQYGWSQWTIEPFPGATGNVAILGTLYAIFGYDPSLIIPVNATFHALSGVLIYLIARLLAPGKVGRYAGLITSTLFIMFPSALNWYGQLHKDGYAISGTLLVLYSWIQAVRYPAAKSTGILLISGTLIGAALIAFVRPYNLTLLLAALILLYIAIIIWTIRVGLTGRFKLWGYGLILICVLSAAIPSMSSQSDQDRGTVVQSYSWQWKDATWMPQIFEYYISALAAARASLIYTSPPHTGSLIDEQIIPDTITSMLLYLPRALEIAFLAPFPDTWFKPLTIVRVVGAGETLIWYLLIPGVFLTLYYQRSFALMLALMFASSHLAVYGLTIANVGTLHRIRYPYLFIFILMGVIGWVSLFLKERRKKNKSVPAMLDAVKERGYEKRPTGRRAITNAGIAVAVLTSIYYLGFFLRDVIMGRWFGLGNELDIFFIATILPMFLVTVFSTPLSGAFIPVFLQLKEQASAAVIQTFISRLSFILNISLLVLCFILLFLSPLLLPALGWGFTEQQIHRSASMMIWVLPLLFFSGMVILGNSILNALGKFALPALAQVCVPIFPILALLLFGESLGIVAVPIGMSLGILVNLLFVLLALKKFAISLYPKYGSIDEPHYRLLLTQYLPLVISAFFMTATIPIGNAMASGLPSGSVAAFGIGNKMVLFITGIIGAGITTVMLPYFSSFIAKNRLIEVREELSFFLFIATIVSIPVSLMLYVISDPLVRLIFEGGAFGYNDSVAVARVMKFGIIQIPFFTCNILLLKFATASRHMRLVIGASVLGLSLNVVLNFLLMNEMGVAGISLATSLSMMASTGLLILMVHKYGHIRWADIVLIGLNWLLFLTLVFCFHLRSYTGIGVAIIALALLIVSHSKTLVGPRNFTQS